MDSKIVLLPTAAEKSRQAEDRVVAENWASALREALAARREQRYAYPLKTGPQARETAQRIGPLAGEYGLDSPVTYRAVAALVTMCHPIVLALMVAGIRTKAEMRRRRPGAKAGSRRQTVPRGSGKRVGVKR
jgi:hypothetical protein